MVNPIEQTVFYNDPTNRGKLWKPPNRQGEQTQHLPKLMLIPPCLMEFVLTATRTAFELYSEIVCLLRLDNPPIDANHAQLLLDWCAAAAQSASPFQEKKSMLEVKITPIFNTVGIVFQKWAHDRLNGTLETLPVIGYTRSGQQIQGAGGPPNYSGATVTALQSVAGVLQQIQQQLSGGGTGGVSAATTNNPTLSKKDVFNDWQVAAIKGWSCIKEATRIQRFWQTIQGVKQDHIIQTELRRGMVVWAKWKGQQIKTGVYLPKDIIECIKKVTPCFCKC